MSKEDSLSNRLAKEMADGTADLSRKPTQNNIPTPSEDVASLTKTVKAIKTVVDTMTGVGGSVLDKALTPRDMLDEGMLLYAPSSGLTNTGSITTTVGGGGGSSGGGGGYTDPRPVFTTPPTPTNLQAFGAFKNIVVSWDLVDYQNHAFTEVWRNTVDNLATATLLDQTPATMISDASGTLGSTYYYWVRAVNFEGVPGAYNASAGVSAGLLKIGNTDLGPLVVEAGNLANGAVTGTKLAASSIDATKFANTIEPVTVVTSVPSTKSTNTIFNSTDGKLYRWNGTAYVASVATSDLAGTLADAQIASLAASKITGQLTNAQIADIAAAKLTGTITSAQIADGSVSGTKFASGLEPVTVVSSVPGTKSTNTIFNTTDGKMYRWNGTAYVASVPAADVSGQLTNSQIADIAAAKLTGTISTAQLADGVISSVKFASGIEPITIVSSVPGTKSTNSIFNTTDGKLYRWNGTAYVATTAAADVTGTLTSAQIADAAITTAKFAAGIKPVEIVAVLPSTGNFAGRVAFLTTDSKLYRHNGTSWISTVPTSDLTGTVSDAQIAGLAASKVTGQLTDSQLAGISAAKLTGAITSTQITDGAISTPKLAAGAVTANEISAGAITTAKLAAGAVTATELAAGAVTTAKIAAGAVTASTIAANTITAGQLAANTITAGQIAAGAIGATEIASGAITTAKLAAGAVTANEIAANAVTTAKLAAGAVTASTIAANTITAGQIAAGAISATQLAANAVTASKLAVVDTTNLIRNPDFAGGSVEGLSVGTNSQVLLATDPSVPANAPTQYVFRRPVPAASISDLVSNAWIAAAPGETFYFEATVAADAGTNGGLILQMRYGDADLSDNLGVTVVSLSNGTGYESWTRVGGTVTVPATVNGFPVAYVRFYIRSALNASPVGAWNIARLIARRAANAEMIVDGSITAGKVAAGAITTAKLAAGAVTANEIAANAVTATQIAAGAITTAKLAAGAVTANELAANSVIAGKVQAGAISATELAAGAVTTAKIAAGAVTAAEISAGAVTTAKIAAGAVTAGEIAANAITAVKIAAGAVETAKIAAGAVTTATMTANSINGDRILANSLDAAKITANSITAGQIQAGAIGATQIAAGAITASKLTVADFSNMCPAGEFRDTASWSLNAGITFGAPPDSNWTSQQVATLTGAAASWVTAMDTTTLGVEPGQKYYLGFEGQITGGTGSIRCDLMLSATSDMATPSYLATTAITSTSYTSVGAQLTIPAGFKFARVRFYKNNDGVTSCRVGRIVLRRAASAELIVDGAITANKIAANAIAVGTAAIENGAIKRAALELAIIDTARIADGQITTAKIGDLQVTDAKIGTISANKITAGSIGVGQYIQSTGYSAGSTGFRINGNGSAEFNGNITMRSFVAEGGEIRNAAGTTLWNTNGTVQPWVTYGYDTSSDVIPLVGNPTGSNTRPLRSLRVSGSIQTNVDSTGGVVELTGLPTESAHISRHADFGPVATTTLQDVPGMTFAVYPGYTAIVRGVLLTRAATTTNGPNYQLAAIAGGGTATIVGRTIHQTTNTAVVGRVLGSSHTATAAANTTVITELTAAVTVTAKTTIKLQLASSSTSSVTLMAGSSLFVQQPRTFTVTATGALVNPGGMAATSPTSAAVSINTNGTSSGSNWYSVLTAGIGAQYEVQFVPGTVTGDGVVSNGAAAFTPITANRGIGLSAPAPQTWDPDTGQWTPVYSGSVSVTATIREIANTANTVSFAITLNLDQ